MSEDRKFDEAAFAKAVAKPNGWSKVADPVAEIHRMRDSDDENLGKLVLRKALSLVRAHFDGADNVFLAKSRELAAILDESGRGALASFVRAQTGDEPSWVPMERKPRVAPGNAAAITKAQLQTISDLVAIAHDEYDGCPSYRDDLERFDRLLTEIKAEVQSAPGSASALREAAERLCSINQPETQDLRQLAKFCHDQSIYGGGLIERVLDDIEIVRQALSAPPEPPSNAAAMREALENARSKFIHIKKCADEGEVSRKKLAILCDFVSREITAALAAPPRNCDLYKDCNAAWKAYNAIGDRERLPGFDHWLFEEAKQEGGAK